MVSAVDVAPARMGGILALADRSEVYRELASRLDDRQRVGIAEANAGARAFAWSALVAQNARTVALVAPSEDRARRCGDLPGPGPAVLMAVGITARAAELELGPEPA